jgi:hypothetical protein
MYTPMGHIRKKGKKITYNTICILQIRRDYHTDICTSYTKITCISEKETNIKIVNLIMRNH